MFIDLIYYNSYKVNEYNSQLLNQHHTNYTTSKETKKNGGSLAFRDIKVNSNSDKELEAQISTSLV